MSNHRAPRARDAGSFVPTAIAVMAFGIAFGYLEAAVVVYLRSAVVSGPVPQAEVAAALGTFEAVELARELGTLVVIGAVGWLAGRSRFERLAWVAVAFGLWDIVYYVGLRVVIGWPPSLGAWDVLLLIPAPWVGPVWAPMTVSASLVVFGLLVARQLRANRPLVLGPWRVLAGLGGGGLVIASFLADSSRVLAGDVTTWTAWPLFWTGMLLATLAPVSALGGRGAGESQGGTWQ